MRKLGTIGARGWSHTQDVFDPTNLASYYAYVASELGLAEGANVSAFPESTGDTDKDLVGVSATPPTFEKPATFPNGAVRFVQANGTWLRKSIAGSVASAASPIRFYTVLSATYGFGDTFIGGTGAVSVLRCRTDAGTNWNPETFTSTGGTQKVTSASNVLNGDAVILTHHIAGADSWVQANLEAAAVNVLFPDLANFGGHTLGADNSTTPGNHIDADIAALYVCRETSDENGVNHIDMVNYLANLYGITV